MTPPNTQQQVIENNVNFRQGYHYYFELDGHQIHAYGSAKSGKEIVYLDDEAVSEMRSFGLSSCHSFSLNGKLVEVEYRMANLLTGQVDCTLIHDGTHVATQKRALKTKYQLNGKRTLFWLPLFFVGGAAFGYGITNIASLFINF